jgi:AAA15 family ATPase/GTPase
MTNFIQNISISNFKSIRSSELKDCARINLFIGRPNVGKSNILEALSLFSLPFLRENTSKKITHFVRLENETELFYNGNYDQPIFVKTDNSSCSIHYRENEALSVDLKTLNGGGQYQIDEKLNFRFGRNEPYNPAVRKYTFEPNLSFKKGHSRYLIPPYGYNLLQVIERDNQLKQEIADMFKEYGLSLVFDKSSQSLKIMQSEKKDIFLIPYNSMADTLQRVIFFKAAIASNKNAVLLFEEPEAHSFPPYIAHITQEMIYRKDNQYFIATHSPFILNDLLENCKEEIAVFNTNYNNHQTEIRRFSETELTEIYQNGVDLFTDNESYI